MSVELDSLEIKIQSSAEQASSGIDKLTATLRRLKEVTKGGAGLTAVANQIAKLNTALSGINVNAGKIGEVAAALNGLADVQKASGLASTVNTLKKLPAVTEQLEAADLNRFAAQMTRVADAVRPLATEMQKVSNGFSAFPIRIQKIIASNTGLAASNGKVTKSFGVLGTGISSLQAKFGIYFVAFRRLASYMAGWVTESNDYVENLNLFNVAMGEGAQAAYDYAYAVRDALGIDPSEWMRNQGVFKQITSGFGVVEEKANLMSKNLTQIGYDISSFFNISIEESMQKVQSGIAGELEPLRRLGYALDVATLQELAYKHGINMKVSAMTQAQKSQLRYLAIMEQSGNVMGDMARTIQTPANAMRILNQQITQLSRAFGNLLIPFLQKIIPYVQAFVQVLTEAIQRLAVLVGFEFPTIDYSGVGGLASGAEDADDALGSAAEAAKDLKNAVLGIDELNVISPNETSGSGLSGGDLGLDLPEYDFLAGLTENDENKILSRVSGILETVYDCLGGIVESVKELVKIAVLPWLTPILDSLKENDSFLGGLTDFVAKMGILAGTSKLLGTPGKIAMSLALTFDAVTALFDGEASWGDIASAIIGMIVMSNSIFKSDKKKGLLMSLGLTLLVTSLAITNQIANQDDAKTKLLTTVGSLLSGALGGAFMAIALAGTGAIGITLGVTLGLVVSGVNVVKQTKEARNAALQQEIDSIAQQVYVSSDWSKVATAMQEKLQEITSENSTITTDLKINIESIQSNLADKLANIEIAQSLIDPIYALSDKAHKTPEELDALKNLIDIFNGLNLDNIKLSFDATGTSISTAKKQLQEMITALKTELQMQAYRELYIEYYKGQAKILLSITTTENERTKAMAAEQSAFNNLAKAQEELRIVQDEINKVQGESTNIFGLFNVVSGENVKTLEELKNKETELKGKVSGCNQAYEEASKVAGEYDSTLSDLHTSLAETNSGLDVVEKELGLLSDGTTTVNGDISTLDTTLDGLNTDGAQKELGKVTDELSGITTEMDNVIKLLPEQVESINKQLGKIIDKIDISIIPSFSSRGYDDDLDYGGQMGPITTRASGGYVRTGQLFLAREAGPELVGAVDGRTAVANNDQIVDGISAGVYRAVVSAMQNTPENERNVNVYLDGKQITASVEKRQRERGTPIMAGGVLA